MHEASFELIEIPHTRQSGKNSADIRMVVDALDLCYTKHHINTFIVISGDSDFSPLVSKLRENAKVVIGVGVRSSTSDLLMSNCDEFIYYNDLVETKPLKKPQGTQRASKNSKDEGIQLVLDTAEALINERGDRVFGSMVKQTLKRRKPGFSETSHGFSSFNEVLESAQSKGLINIESDEKSGGYVVRGINKIKNK